MLSVLPLVISNSVTIEYGKYLLPIILYFVIKYVTERLNASGGKTLIKEEFRRPTKPTNLLPSDANDGQSSEASESDDGLRPSLPNKQHIPYPGIKYNLDDSGVSFYNMVNDRRSVRKFSNRTVDFEVIRKCVEAAGTSPSGAHTEPWTFCVIEDPLIKAQIRQIIEDEESLNYAQRMSRQWVTDLKPLKTNFVKEYLTEAPYLVLVFKQTHGFRADGQKQQHYYNEISVAISVGVLLCALQSVGLNSLVTTPLNSGPALRTLLDRSANEKLLVLLPVGYAADDCHIPNLSRKHVDEILVKY